MTTVLLTPGVLPQPACYATEQERFVAYVNAIIASLESDPEWIVQADVPGPDDTDKHWLKLGSDTRPIGAYEYVVADGEWVPWLWFPITGTTTGAGNAYSLTNTPPFSTTGEAYALFRTYKFLANFNTTGASTLNIDGLGPKAIKVKVSEDTALNTIKTGQIVEVVYDGTNFQMVSAVSAFNIVVSDLTPGDNGQFLRTRTDTAVWETSLYKTAFDDAEDIPAHGTPITINHGLLVQPAMAGMNFVCIDPLGDMGYSQFDEIPVTGTTEISSDDDDNIPTVWSTTTVVGYITCTESVTNPRVANKSTGVIGSIDPTKWKLLAWAMK